MHIDDGLTLQQVADRLGVAYVTVSKWWSDGEFDRYAPGEKPDGPFAFRTRSATGYDPRRGRLVDPAVLDTFVPPQHRARAAIAAVGRLTAPEAAAFIGCSLPTVNRAAQLHELAFVLIDGVRAFDRTDLQAWQAAKNAPPTGPLMSFADASRRLGHKDGSGVTRLVQRGRLSVVINEHGRKRLFRADVEELAAKRAARKARRA